MGDDSVADGAKSLLGREEARERYTDAEWTAIIAQTERDLVVSDAPRRCPDVPSTEFFKTIDHTLLKLEVREVQFDELCAEARTDRFATVCVRPPHVKQCVSNLKGSDVKVASVIGFHEGTYDLLHKAQETKLSLQSGASELDIVINYPQLKSGAYAAIYKELATLRLQAPHPVQLKLILETSQLTPHHIIAGSVLAAAANFDFVKTSTGFNGPGATVAHVRLMAACCEHLAVGREDGRKMRVKASGGIRTLADAVTMLEAGASRLGTSGGVWIAKEAKEVLERSVSPPSVEAMKRERPGMTTRLFTDY